MHIDTRWGSYDVLYEAPQYKVKTLTIKPGKGISYQKHLYRSEHWYISEGKISVALDYQDGLGPALLKLGVGANIRIGREQFHQVWNHSDKDATIIEIQVGRCEETDIVRYKYDWILD